jgi:hypothetical protein
MIKNALRATGNLQGNPIRVTGFLDSDVKKPQAPHLTYSNHEIGRCKTRFCHFEVVKN